MSPVTIDRREGGVGSSSFWSCWLHPYSVFTHRDSPTSLSREVGSTLCCVIENSCKYQNVILNWMVEEGVLQQQALPSVLRISRKWEVMPGIIRLRRRISDSLNRLRGGWWPFCCAGGAQFLVRNYRWRNPWSVFVFLPSWLSRRGVDLFEGLLWLQIFLNMFQLKINHSQYFDTIWSQLTQDLRTYRFRANFSLLRL